MSEEEFHKIEEPTYSDYKKRYGSFAKFMWETKSYDSSNDSWKHPMVITTFSFGIIMIIFPILMGLI